MAKTMTARSAMVKKPTQAVGKAIRKLTPIAKTMKSVRIPAMAKAARSIMTSASPRLGAKLVKSATASRATPIMRKAYKALTKRK